MNERRKEGVLPSLWLPRSFWFPKRCGIFGEACRHYSYETSVIPIPSDDKISLYYGKNVVENNPTISNSSNNISSYLRLMNKASNQFWELRFVAPSLNPQGRLEQCFFTECFQELEFQQAVLSMTY